MTRPANTSPSASFTLPTSAFGLAMTAWLCAMACTTYDAIPGLNDKSARRSTTNPARAAQSDAGTRQDAGIKKRTGLATSPAKNGSGGTDASAAMHEEAGTTPRPGTGGGAHSVPGSNADSGLEGTPARDGTSAPPAANPCQPEDCPDASAQPMFEGQDLSFGDPCSSDAQCMSGECAGGSCAAGAADAPCSKFTDCESEICRRGVCGQDPKLETCEGGPCPDPALSTTCSPGTFVINTSGGAVVCGSCPSGSFSVTDNAAGCKPWRDCSAGTFVGGPGTSSSDRQCLPCPNGTDSQVQNAGSCLAPDACAAGTVASGPSADTGVSDSCTPCSAGDYCAGGDAAQESCAAGSWDDDGDPATPCIAKTTCLKGQYIASDGSALLDRSCTPCAAGTFSRVENSASCMPWSRCGAGSYVMRSGMASEDRVCAPCAPGTFSRLANAVTCTAWQACQAGTFLDLPGSDTADRVCTACAAGSFTETPNEDRCEDFTVCSSPLDYMVSDGTASTDRTCGQCTPPLVTVADNEAQCVSIGTGAFQMSNGQVVLEAEHYDDMDDVGAPDTWVLGSQSTASGGEYMVMDPDDGDTYTSNIAGTSPRMSYQVNFTETGLFYVHVRAVPRKDNGVSDSCYIGLNGVVSSGFVDFNGSSTWTWRTKTLEVNTTGEHTFQIFGREDGTYIDKVVISVSSTAPSGEGPAESPRG